MVRPLSSRPNVSSPLARLPVQCPPPSKRGSDSGRERAQRQQAEQPRAEPLHPNLPLLEAVRERGQRLHEASFHVPGHKRGAGSPPPLSQLLGEQALHYDLTELEGKAAEIVWTEIWWTPQPPQAFMMPLLAGNDGGAV